MTTLSNLVVKFNGDASGLVRAARIGTRMVKGFAKGTARLGVGLAKVGVAAGLAGVAVGVAFVRGASQAIDELRKLSSNLGTTVRQTQELKLAAQFSGTSLSTMSKSVQQVTRTVGDAQRGLKSASDAIEDLGLNTDRLARLNAADRFREVVKALAQMEDPTKRASVAAVVLGRGWRELNPLIATAEETFKRTASVIQELNLGLRDGDNTSEMLVDSWTELVEIGKLLSLKVFEALAPTINALVESMLGLARGSIKAAGGGERLAAVIGTRIIEATRNAIQFFNQLTTVVRNTWAIIGPILEAIVQAMAGLGAVGAAIFRGEFSGAGAAANAAIADIINTVTGTGEDDQVQKDQLTEQQRQTRALETIVADGIAAVAG